MNDREELRYLVWLASAVPTGSVLPLSLLKCFGSARAVWEADAADLDGCGVDLRGRRDAFLKKDTDYASRILEYCDKNSVAVTTVADPFYPQRLRALPNPPLLFYHIGNFCDLDLAPSVTVVGSREPSPYGERAAKRLSVDLARGGAVLVSGLARGIDSLAHRAALYCGTFTVGVLGCGIDRAYPPENRELIASVAENGLVLTEYAPGTPPAAPNFPMRNRLLAALSPVTLVVEAAATSGSLITADYSLRLKKDLFTVPSPIFSATGAGANHLLRCGAHPALRAEDILDLLAREFPGAVRSSAPEKPEKKRATGVKGASFAFAGSRAGGTLPEFSGKVPPQPKAREKKFEKCSLIELTEDERALLKELSFEPKPAEALASEKLSAAKLLQILTSLELKGYAERTSGNRFCLVDEA